VNERLSSAIAKPSPPETLNPDSVSRLERPVALAMWDFSWILRHHRHGEFEDWDRVLDGLAERGYNAIRMDCMPQFVAADTDGVVHETFRSVKSSWKPSLWGNNASMTFNPREALLKFLPKCRERGIKVGLSTWFMAHGTGREAIFNEEGGLLRAWQETLEFLDDNGLLDRILYADVLNEYPLWHGEEWFKKNLNDRADVKKFSESNPDANIPNLDNADVSGRYNPLQLGFINSYMEGVLGELRSSWPQIDFFPSISHGMPPSDLDLTAYSAFDFHVWFVHHPGMNASGYSKIHSMANDNDFGAVYTAMKTYWKENRTEMISWMDSQLASISEQAASYGIPCGNTEGWGPIMWIDHPDLDWKWVKEAGEIGADLAVKNGYKFICTSNFTHPQFPGMWDDIAWHKRVTAAITS